MTVQLKDKFWSDRMDLNRTVALMYQWEQYNACGTVENFRLIADKKQGKRNGYFYTDSDLHKWTDAVSRGLATVSDEKLKGLLDEYISLMGKAQDADGYLFTWNQIYFPGTRWKNIQVEHELYTAGHFIEAGISHFQATGEKTLLNMGVKLADLIVGDFRKITSSNCPGHQEIEIALIKLYRVTGDDKYINTAERFLSKRGRGRFFGLTLLSHVISHGFRSNRIKRKDRNEGSKELGFEFSENIHSREPRFLAFRAFFAFISGSYQQQHKSLLKQTEPKGHAVRWAYMMYAATMLALEKGDADISLFLSKSWENLVRKKMYITGGIGSLPVIEGFGRNYELNNEFSYSETCAAIGSIFWNNEMLKLSPQARYADLVERQLYNAASVGISQDGKKYFYRNPLESHGEIERQSWFKTACCPSNISRLWADIHTFIYHEAADGIYINQYLGSVVRFTEKDIHIELTSGFPWDGQVEIRVSCTRPAKLMLRIPGWALSWTIRVNGDLFYEESVGGKTGRIETGETSRLYTDIAERADYREVKLPPGSDHRIEMEIPMEILVNRADDRVKENRGKIALSRGPLVYCIESEKEIDEPVSRSSLRFYRDEHSFSEKSGYISDGKVSFIPYYLWGNRGKKKMKVWVESKN
ncbi:MAG: glycoside hydrolase family 127 protein [Spirochaetales bacterium]|nr:glycoside hydrolase family 127 protein [Spirochaetales bacterium]